MDPLGTHTQLFGSTAPPTEKQKAFYADPVSRGFSAKGHEVELADSILVRALAQVREVGSPDYHKVVIFSPKTERDLIISRVHNIAQTTMTRIMPILKTPKGQATIAHVRLWLEALQLGPIEAWKNATPPPRWVAFGYSKDDNVPTWLKDGLI